MSESRCGWARSCSAQNPFRAAGILVLFLLMVPVVSAGTIEVFSQDYALSGSIPDNVVNTNYQSPYISDISLWYSGGRINGQWNATNKNGYILIGGLTPAVNTTYNLVVDFNRTNQNSQYNIKSGYMFIVLQKYDAGYWKVYQHYDDISHASIFTVPAASITYPFNLTITFDGANHTYTSKVGSYSQTTPFMGGPVPLAYPVVQGNSILFNAYAASGENNATVSIYSLNQTIPATGSITAIGDKNLVSFGFDGPHPAGSWEDGAAVIESAGGKGTIWADPRTSWYMTAPNIANITHLLGEGWELGVHFDRGLTSDPDPYGTIDSEVAVITTTFGQAPTSWCSLQNADNATLANYAYANHGMIWRNGLMGEAELGSIGNLYNTTWPFWANVSRGGITFRSFTHKTDISPAELYSIDPSKFQTWVDNYADKGMKISPYIAWYKTGANSHDAAFTKNPDPKTVLNFTVHTNGYPAYVYVNLPYASGYKAYNTMGPTEVSRVQAPDGNIQFYVDDGLTYYIPAKAPKVTGISPATGPNTTTVSITNLAGTGFYGSPKVILMRTGQSNITAKGVTVVDHTSVSCSLDLAGKPSGVYDVVLSNPNGEEGLLPHGFTIVASDVPVTGDFNNDGKTDIGVFRYGQWILDYGMDGTVNRRFNYGLASDRPVKADFNDDGIQDTGVYRSGQWILDYGIDGSVNRRFQYGI